MRELVSFKSRKCRWKEQGKRRLEVIDIIDSSAPLPRIAKPIVKAGEAMVWRNLGFCVTFWEDCKQTSKHTILIYLIAAFFKLE